MHAISKEDYLRSIFHLYESRDDPKSGIKSVEIARQMNVSKPSVSEMVKKLAKEGFVKAEPYSDIFLTKNGEKEAKRLMHNHRVIEVFLTKVLKCDMNKVHSEAHRLEHAFSNESIKKLDKFLKNPRISPHGRRIPH